MSQGRPAANGCAPATTAARARRALTHAPILAVAAVLLTVLVAPAAVHARPYVYRVPGGGKLIVPRTSITDGARVVIRRAKGPAVDAGSRALGRPVSLKMRHGRLVGSVRLILPLRGHVRTRGFPYQSTVRLAYYNARARRWETVPATINRKRRTISARLRHFSWYNPLSWDWDSIVLRLDQRIGELRGARTAPAPCNSGVAVPSWADTVTSNAADIQMRTCAEGEKGTDRVVVQMVNNRPFGMVLRYGARVAWGWHETPDDAAGALATMLMENASAGDELYIAPLKRASVGVPRGDWWFAQFQASITPESTFADVLMLAADKIDISLVRKEFVGKLWAECSGQIKGSFSGLPTTQKDALGWVGAASSCMLKALPAAAAAGKLDGVSIEKLQKSLQVLSAIGTGASVGKLAGQVADWVVARNATWPAT